MRLTALAPSVPQELAFELDKIGITTEMDLLFRETPLEIFQKLPQGTISLKDLKSLILRVTELCAAPGVVSSDIPSIHNTPLPSGLPCLDRMTDCFVGLPVAEIAGEVASGKTSLVLTLALRLLATDPSSAVLWIDTRGDFSVERAVAVVSELNLQTLDVFDRLRVSTALELDAVYGVLWSLQLGQSNEVKCIIIDNITSLLSSYFSPTSAQGHAIMTGFMRYLRELAQQCSLTILVINNSTSLRESTSSSILPWTTRKPALGPSFAFQSDCTVWLSKQEQEAEITHYAEILYSRAMASNTYCSFKIHNGVLKELV